jgi:hypothetical protein
MTSDELARGFLHKPPRQPATNPDLSYVIRIFVAGDGYMPTRNPAYLDGVPIWFENRVFVVPD